MSLVNLIKSKLLNLVAEEGSTCYQLYISLPNFCNSLPDFIVGNLFVFFNITDIRIQAHWKNI